MNSTPQSARKLNSPITASTTGPRHVFKLGLDVDLHLVVTAMRVLLVKAIWRLLRWQPGWHARLKYLQRLNHGVSPHASPLLDNPHRCCSA